jgi:hypothetical protein
VLGLVTIVSVGTAVKFSLDPDKYFRYPHMEYPAWSHPTAHVAFVVSIILFEGLAAILILVGPWPKRFWIRGLVGATLLVIWGQFSTLYVVHMPGYVLIHHLWVWLLSFAVAAVVLVSLVLQFANRKFNVWRGKNSRVHTPQ